MFFGGDPFGGAGGRRGPPKEVNNTEYYEILGVDKDASDAEIKKAYKRMAVKHHPDKGGDEARFKEITEAADVLLDEEKRKVYDQHGKEGLEAGMGEGGGDDLFSALFGGGRRQQQRQRQIAPIERSLEVDLEDFYNGGSSEVTVTRKRTCTACQGTGSSEPGVETTCDSCKGRGVKLIVRQIAPGFVQQMQAPCEKCEGTGNAIPPHLVCKTCDGDKLMTENKTLTVEVHKGMPNKDKVIFREEGHLIPELPAGDVVVMLVSRPHDVFKRKENDLLVKYKISLAEALDSSKAIKLKHMDGRPVVISRPAGCIIRPGHVMRVDGEGMPKKENPNLKGDLYLEFEVVFPEVLDAETEDKVVGALAPHCPPVNDYEEMNLDDHWDCSMEEVDLGDYGKKSKRHRQAYDEEAEDSEDEEGRGGVQCQQM